MANTYLGIDVSKKTLDVVLLNGRDNYKVFENTEKGFRSMQKWLEKHDVLTCHVCLEATGQYGFPIAEYLHGQGHQVSVVNPFRIKAYRKTCMVRNKTDKLDAYVIADFCKRHEPAAWAPPEPCYVELRSLTRHLDSLMNMRQQEVNRKKSGISSAYVLNMIAEHIEQLDKNIKDIKQQIQSFITEHKPLKHQQDLLVSIPGVGELTATRLLAEIEDVQRFQNARQLAAYAGVTPQQHTSGTSVHGKSRMSKMGNVYLRKSLYMPALVAKHHNPIIQVFCERLTNRNKIPKVVIGAAMRKLLHIVYGILKSDRPFDPNYLTDSAHKA
jgi:transposase